MKVGSLATWFVLTSISVASVSGCRTTRSEAGLRSSAYLKANDHVVANDRGAWFAVRAQGAPQKPFVVIGDGPERELYRAAWMGPRTARIMPVSPGAYALLDANRGDDLPMTWIDNPSEAGELSDAVGWLTDNGGSAAWTRVPSDGTPVILVNAMTDARPEIAKWFAGTAIVKGGKLTQMQVAGEGPWLALPDGAVASRPIRVATSGFELAKHNDIAVTRTDIRVEADRGTTEFTMRPVALTSQADALAAESNGNVTITLARPVLREGTTFAITDVPLRVVAEDADEALLGLRDVAAGRYLRAAWTLSNVRSTQPGAHRMRVAELVAAAGYVDWARAELIDRAKGLGPDTSYYLGRSHLISGDFDRARDFATRSRRGFLVWKGVAGPHGSGQALMLSSAIEAKLGELDAAYDFALDAAEAYEAALDPMRAASAELVAAHLAVQRDDLVSAVKAAALARSRYFHGDSSYFAAFAELALSDIYLVAGDTGEAQKMGEYARSRFEKMNDEVGANRAKTALGRVLGASEPSSGLPQIETALNTAQSQGDFVGVVDAAASLVGLGGVPEDASATYGLVIAAGLARTADPGVRGRAAQALAILCGQGMLDGIERIPSAAPADIAVAKRACASAVNSAPKVELGSLLATARSELRVGGPSAAEPTGRAIERQMASAEVRERASASVVLAAVQPSQWQQRVTDAIDIVLTMDPVERPDVLATLAREAAAVGHVEAANDLFSAGQLAAADANQSELRRSIAMERVRLLHATGRLDAAMTASRNTTTVLGTAGARGIPGILELGAIEVDCLERLGKSEQAEAARNRLQTTTMEADDAQQATSAVRRAVFAAQRGEFDRADALMELADKVGATALELNYGLAVIAFERGGMREAASLFGQAREAGGAADLELAATRGLAMSTTDPDTFAIAISQLDSMKAKFASSQPQIAGEAAVGRIEVELSAGHPQEVVKLSTAAGPGGVVSANRPVDAICAEAKGFAIAADPTGASRLDRCTAVARGEARSEAEIVRTLASDSNKTDKVREVRAAASSSPALIERAKYVSDLSAGTVKLDDKRDEKLKAALKSAPGNPAKAAAVETMVRYYLSCGEAHVAGQRLDEEQAAFYDSPAGRGRLDALRASVLLAKLEPVAAIAAAQRSLAQNTNLDPSDTAELNWVLAQSSAILGMKSAARRYLAAARVGAAPELRPKLNAFTSRLSGM